MTTDARSVADLGIRLRQLRTDAGLSGKALAGRLGWPPSKVSKLETGSQTPTLVDLEAWATATGHPDTIAELTGRLRGLESTYRPWHLQLAAGGHRAVQDTHGAQHANARSIRTFSASVIPGILQTADYARNILSHYADLHGITRDLDAGVDARLRWQDNLYTGRTEYEILIWEPALHARICPPEVLLAQLDRLISANGLRTLSLGIIPLTADIRLAGGDNFWIFDYTRVIVETWHAEMWLDVPEETDFYHKIWNRLNEVAVYEHDAHRLLMRARAALSLG